MLSFSVPELDPSEAAVLLSEAHITARTGFHCAPWIHQHLGTGEAGTIRVSAGPFTDADDVPRVPRALGLE